MTQIDNKYISRKTIIRTYLNKPKMKQTIER